MRGRLVGVAVGASSVQLAKRNPFRTSIQFSVGDSTNASSVVVTDLVAATSSNGFPLTWSQYLRLEGEIATHEFNAIRLAGVNCVVGVIEGFPDGDPDRVESDEVVSGPLTQVPIDT